MEVDFPIFLRRTYKSSRTRANDKMKIQKQTPRARGVDLSRLVRFFLSLLDPLASTGPVRSYSSGRSSREPIPLIKRKTALKTLHLGLSWRRLLKEFYSFLRETARTCLMRWNGTLLSSGVKFLDKQSLSYFDKVVVALLLFPLGLLHKLGFKIVFFFGEALYLNQSITHRLLHAQNVLLRIDDDSIEFCLIMNILDSFDDTKGSFGRCDASGDSAHFVANVESCGTPP